jgi:hypothetical protein
MSRWSKGLGEDVGDVGVRLDVEELEDALRDPVADHMVFHINVLCPSVVHDVLRNTASSNVVNVGADGQGDGQELVEQVAEIEALSASLP